MIKTVLVLAFVCFVAARLDVHEAKGEFFKFVKTYKRTYASEQERMKRFGIFQDNLVRAERYNKLNPSAKFGVTKFADLTAEEFNGLYKMPNFQSHVSEHDDIDELIFPEAPLPTNYDWRDHGAVTAVKNQEQCGSCWAFSATEAIESAWFLAGHTLVSLAPQQIVDCDVGHGDEGCNGGDTTTAYQYVMRAGGMETESDYPYVGEDEPCKFAKSDVVATISNWAYITKNKNETQMQVGLVNQGPLSICVDAESWQLYIEGVISSSYICGDSLDHCVMITGFQNYEDGVWGTYSVWNIRNSWGSDWGLSGYILVERGYDLCGVADEVTVPII